MEFRHICVTENSTFALVHPRRSRFLSISATHRDSVLGPVLFTAYIAPIKRLLNCFGVEFLKYADDTQLHAVLLNFRQVALNRPERCSTELQRWFWHNDLLNSDKSEMIYYGTRELPQRSYPPSTVSEASCGVVVSNNFIKARREIREHADVHQPR